MDLVITASYPPSTLRIELETRLNCCVLVPRSSFMRGFISEASMLSGCFREVPLRRRLGFLSLLDFLLSSKGPRAAIPS